MTRDEEREFRELGELYEQARHALDCERTRLAAAESRATRLAGALDYVTSCEEHLPCGLCREQVRAALREEPGHE